jgi:hypothetical protein
MSLTNITSLISIRRKFLRLLPIDVSEVILVKLISYNGVGTSAVQKIRVAKLFVAVLEPLQYRHCCKVRTFHLHKSTPLLKCSGSL